MLRASLLVFTALLTGVALAHAPDPQQNNPRSIPLNPKDPTYNMWKQFRDTSKDAKREPGLIHVHKYIGGFAWHGISTFFKLPVALNPQDLIAGKTDVAIVGAPLDMSLGMRGAAFGPKSLRSSDRYLGYGALSMPHMHVLINPFEVLTIADYGDIAVDPLSTERSMEHIRETVRQIAETKTIPIIVGGDHSLMYPDVAGLADVYGKGTIGVVHFDAHYDASKNVMGHLISHGSPVYRLIKEGHVKGKNFIQVGLRGYYPDKKSFEWMRKEGFKYHTMAEIDKKGWPTTMKEVLAEARDGTKYLFISLDIDVLDPAFTPGTGTPEPAGLTTRELFPLIRSLCAENNVVGFELVEINPLTDPGYTTTLNANRLLRECLTGMAMRKKGITDGSYLSPLTKEHGSPLSIDKKTPPKKP
jgi:guanidinobutyrase